VGVLELTKKTNLIISVFGSSRTQVGSPEYSLAYNIGASLAQAGMVVCNGGYSGIMEASAHGAKDAGGHTLGITTRSFAELKANQWIDEEIPIQTLIERLMKLISVADGYVVLKGGTGTLLELAAVWELMNKNVTQQKPIVVIGDYWNGVVDTLKNELAWEGLQNVAQFVTVVHTPSECVEILKKKLDVPLRQN
jgi:uncharacterized protein (TIGR00725 family)